MYKTLTQLRFFLFLFIVFIASSCQREISFEDIDAVVDHVSDSTLLIKSITLLSDTGLDSVVENYSYDSVNRKITLTWNDPSSSQVPDGTAAEFSYNSDWLITHAAYTYPAGYIPDASDYTAIDIVYDATRTLKQITVNYGDGSTETKVYTMTSLSSGNYQLSWDESDPGTPDDRVLRRAIFNAAGKNVVNVVEHSFVADVSPAGDDIFTNYITSDTLSYDASGSVNKIIRNETDTLRHTSQSYLAYNFSSRQTRGDQLYNQRQAIMNGIANMPFFDPDSNTDLLGILSFSLENEYWQYLKYPVQTADIHWNMTDYHFVGASEFDTLNRLIKFKGFVLDLGLSERVFKIKYYK